MNKLLPIFLLGLMLFSCGDDNNNPVISYEEQLAIDNEIIEEYLSTNNLTAEEGDFGLRYIIQEEGTGEDFPTQVSTVVVKFKGYYTDGVVFDERDIFQVGLGSLGAELSGWRLGIPLLKKEGKGTFILPSSLGYGPFPRAGVVVPPNQVVIFDIELITFE